MIGDALGVPYEFHPRDRIPPTDQIEFEPPAGFQRAHRGVPPGTWSDDGAQLLCLLESLLHRGTFDPDDLGKRLLAWFERGHLAVDNHVFDCGVQTSRALRLMMGGAAASTAGPSDEQANGNGSLMRVLPLALWHEGSDEELIDLAHRQSRLTHGHPRSQVCCALYSLWARRTLDGGENPWRDAVDALREAYAEDPMYLGELEYHVRPDDDAPGNGSGYVVDCLRSARWATEQGDYEATVKAAIRLGRDTDTTACVAGGIAGLRDGIDAIPRRWREELRGEEWLTPLLHDLLTTIQHRT